MKRRRFFICIAVLAGLMSACQPTPESKVVIGKGGENFCDMLKKAGVEAAIVNGDVQINADDDSDFNYEESTISYDSPDKLEYILTRGNTVVEFNAVVNIPEYQLPIYIVKPDCIYYETVSRFLKLLGNEELYDHEFATTVRTKKIIEGEIANYMRAIKLLSENETIDEGEVADQEQFIQGEIEKLYKEMEIAPASYEEAATIIEFGKTVSPYGKIITKEMTKPIVIDENNYNVCNYTLMLGESAFPKMVNIAASSNKQTQQLLFLDWNSNVNSLDKSMSEESIKMVIAPYVKLLGSNLSLIDYRYVDEDSLGKGYQFIYKRLFNGVESNYARGQSGGWRAEGDGEDGGSSADVYSLPYQQEGLVIEVDSDGNIYFLSYNSPVAVDRALTNNAQLLPFEDIKEVLDRYIGLHGFNPEDNVKITITEAKLGLMRIDIPNNDDQYLIIPVWDFYGYYERKYIYQGVEFEIPANESLAYQCYLTINAIDGSIIDRELGY